MTDDATQPPASDYDKSYTVRLTEKEMQTIANCMTAYFNHMTAIKKTIPLSHADHVFSALQKMKAACEGKAVLVRVQ